MQDIQQEGRGPPNFTEEIITGRNEVVAKVMFLQVSVCPQGGRVSASVHAGMPDPPGPGSHPPGVRQTPPGPGRPPRDQADPSGTRQTSLDQADPPGPGRPPLGPGRPPSPGDQADTPRIRQTPPGKQTPAYGLRAAGTHPTGMHSCYPIFLPNSSPR